jgi:hypothetical protein
MIIIIGVDFGDLQEKRLAHREEGKQFYRSLAAVGSKCV